MNRNHAIFHLGSCWDHLLSVLYVAFRFCHVQDFVSFIRGVRYARYVDVTQMRHSGRGPSGPRQTSTTLNHAQQGEI